MEQGRKGSEASIASIVPDLSSLDLRFRDLETEALFKASVEPEILRWGVLGALILELLIPLTLVPVYIEEQSNVHNPYRLRQADVRTVMLVLWLLCFAITGLFCCGGLLRIWRGWFAGLNWEALFVAMTTYYALNLALANFWHLPLIFGIHPTEVWSHDARGAEVFVLLGLDGIMTVVAMYIPIRSCALWVLPLCGVGCYVILLVAVDSVFPADRFKSVCALIALTIVACHGAYRNEKQRREKWIALQQVLEATEVVKLQETEIAETTALVKGLRTVANALCDIIVKLTQDLRVCGAESVLDAFFEQKMEGRKFADVLPESDRQRFAALVEGVSRCEVHACMPVTIKKTSSMCEANLLLVDTGRDMPRYFLGIRVEMEHLEPVEDPCKGLIEPLPGPGLGPLSGHPLAAAWGPPPQPGDGHFMGLVPSPPPGPTLGLGQVNGLQVCAVSQEDQDSDFSFTSHLKPVGQALAYTSVRARAISLKKVMPRWNIPRDAESCCQFHTVVESIHEVADFLSGKQCEPLWSTLSGGQCNRCKSMCTQTRTKCVVCGYNHREGPGLL